MGNRDVLAIVRAFNEAPRVGAVISELRGEFSRVVCVDDGSTDRTAEAARQAGATVVRHRENLGGGAALRTGLDYMLKDTDANLCLTFDADGQHRVEDARRMVARARSEQWDVVLATRFGGTTVDMPWTRRLVLRAGTVFTRATTGLRVSDTHNGLRVFSRHAVRKLQLTQSGMAYASELTAAISRHGLSWCEEPVTILYDEYSLAKGQSSLNAVNIIYDLTMARLRTH